MTITSISQLGMLLHRNFVMFLMFSLLLVLQTMFNLYIRCFMLVVCLSLGHGNDFHLEFCKRSVLRRLPITSPYFKYLILMIGHLCFTGNMSCCFSHDRGMHSAGQKITIAAFVDFYKNY